ncbi:MAG TPA: DUF4239 domain-containing protein [Terriglobales bacterium]|nr:DUF4239 domain-containing protein [Terriglobales bacterium]
MLNTWENFVGIALAVGASLFFMWTLNRLWAPDSRHVNNNLIGWQLSVLGTTYAVILGFMLYTVWNDFGLANLNVENEANDMANLYRIAAGLPDPQKGQIETLVRSYADSVTHQDWPQMAADQIPETSGKINQELWKTLMSVRAASPTENIALDHALSELSALTEHRRIRVVQSAFRLPSVLWCVLIIGGVVTIASTAMFGSANRFLHAFQVFCFSLLVALVLLAVADIDRPFQGSIHVSDYAFQRAQTHMQD